MTKERLFGMFDSILYLKGIAEEENEPEIAEELQKVSDLIFSKTVAGMGVKTIYDVGK